MMGWARGRCVKELAYVNIRNVFCMSIKTEQSVRRAMQTAKQQFVYF
jgi:hypothetical protein